MYLLYCQVIMAQFEIVLAVYLLVVGINLFNRARGENLTHKQRMDWYIISINHILPALYLLLT